MENNFIVREVKEEDAPILRHLAKNCPPLDLHTQYTYWVVASAYGDYSFLAYEKGGDSPIGYVMCVKTQDSVFFWQIGVLEDYRGKGLSRILIDAVFKKAEKNKDRPTLGVTIAKDNQNSYFAFHNYCRDHGYSFIPDRTISVTDADDPLFLEEEIYYRMEKA